MLGKDVQSNMAKVAKYDFILLTGNFIQVELNVYSVYYNLSISLRSFPAYTLDHWDSPDDFSNSSKYPITFSVRNFRGSAWSSLLSA